MLRTRSISTEGRQKLEIGSKLKNARNEHGMTQEQVAELLGVSRQTISNWENNKSYPDIISVIKMSDIYSVSLDHLLKEEKSMNQTYQEYLEESTNTVKAKKNLSKIVLVSTYFLVWALTLIASLCSHMVLPGDYAQTIPFVIRYFLLPVFLFTVSMVIGRNDYFGKLKWLTIIIAAITFFTIPSNREFIISDGYFKVYFYLSAYTYVIGGIVIAAVGLAAGVLLRHLAAKKHHN